MNFDFELRAPNNDLVILKPIGTKDFEKLFSVASDPLIWEQHPSSNRYKEEIFRPFFEDALDSGMAYLIFDAENEEIIGSSRYYAMNEENSSIAIGYTFLARKYWGGRHNYAAKKLMLDHAFSYFDKVFLHIGPQNIRSQMATLKLGAVKVGENEKDHLGHERPNWEYLITKEEWLKNNL